MAALAGEPWCFAPAALAALTDAQLDALYFAPRDDKGHLIPPHAVAAAAHQVEAEPFWTRPEFVAVMLNQFGETAEHWHSQYSALNLD